MPGLCGTLRRWRAEERAGERRRKDPTSLQQACNRFATSLQLWGRSCTATVLLRRRSGGATGFFLLKRGEAAEDSGSGVTTQAAGDPGRVELGRTKGGRGGK